jgi:hypothetical protein
MFSLGYFMVGIKMNDRIRQLAEQAGFEITPWSNKSVPCVHQEGPIDVELEKFARLIVEECVIRAEREWVRNGLHTEHNQAVSKVIESIKQHFGVEE